MEPKEVVVNGDYSPGLLQSYKVEMQDFKALTGFLKKRLAVPRDGKSINETDLMLNKALGILAFANGCSEYSAFETSQRILYRKARSEGGLTTPSHFSTIFPYADAKNPRTRHVIDQLMMEFRKTLAAGRNSYPLRVLKAAGVASNMPQYRNDAEAEARIVGLITSD